jgi:F-type H+-transporting ATPase subunit b
LKRLIVLTILIAAAGCVSAQERSEKEGAQAKQETEAPEQDLSGWKLANFAILAGVLGYFIAKKSGPFFAARGAGIRKELDQAGQTLSEAKARYAEMEQRLRNLGLAVEGLKAEARKESEAERSRILEETERDLGKIRAQAEQEIASAAKTARQDLRAYSAELAVRLAAEKIRRELTPQADDEFIRGMVSDLGGQSRGEARV